MQDSVARDNFKGTKYAPRIKSILYDRIAFRNGKISEIRNKKFPTIDEYIEHINSHKIVLAEHIAIGNELRYILSKINA